MGLLDTFRRSEDIATVVHASPGARIAQFELLKGLCYAAGIYPRTHQQWLTWNRTRRPLDDVAERLESSDFDGLLDVAHPEHPFGQNALLAPYLDAYGYGPAQLEIERCGDYAQLADHVHLHDPEPLPVHEAVLAMLTQHHFALGGRVMAKAAWFGSAFTYGSVGRLGSRVRTLALGDTLADTLRLNLTPFPDDPKGPPAFGGFNFSWTGSTHRRTFKGAEAQRRRTPSTPADLHSVLGRSVLLRLATAEDGRPVVDRVLMGAGELLEPLGQTWLQDAVMVGDKPLQATAERGLWRDAHALYAASATHTKGTDLFSRLADLDRRVTLWSVGLVAKQRAVTGWVTDSFPYVPSQEAALLRVSQDAVAWTEFLHAAVQKAAVVARDVIYPHAGPERTKLLHRFHPGPQLFARFEAPFHDLLDDIAAGVDEEAARLQFAQTLVAAARAAVRERLQSLPQTATALEATVRTEDRFERELESPRSPALLKKAAQS